MNLVFFKLFVGKVLKNGLKMFYTEKMVLWGLKFASKITDNLVDDKVVEIIGAAYKNDTVAFQAALEGLLKTVKEGQKEAGKK